jgi:hypothetical protein
MCSSAQAKPIKEIAQLRDVKHSRLPARDRLPANVERQQPIHPEGSQNQLNPQNHRIALQANKTCGYVSFDNGLSPGSGVNS